MAPDQQEPTPPEEIITDDSPVDPQLPDLKAQGDQAAPSGSAPSPPSDEDVGWLDRRYGGRPLIVYLAMAAGLGVLALLLGIVWISATGGGEADEPVCLDISPADAETAILKGQVEKMIVLTDETNKVNGLTLIQLTMDNGECSKLPEGADNREFLYETLGVATHFNETSDDKIRIEYTYKPVPKDLLLTSTPTATNTAEPTVGPTQTAEPATEPAEIPAETATSAPTEASTEVPPTPADTVAATPTA